MRRSGPLPRRTPLRRYHHGLAVNWNRVDPKLRRAVYDRAGGCCDRCGRLLPPAGFEAHHRKLRSRGGQDSAANLLALCPGCHAWCHNHPGEATLAGFIVPSYTDPARVPVYRHLAAWVLPRVDGWTTPEVPEAA